MALSSLNKGQGVRATCRRSWLSNELLLRSVASCCVQEGVITHKMNGVLFLGDDDLDNLLMNYPEEAKFPNFDTEVKSPCPHAPMPLLPFPRLNFIYVIPYKVKRSFQQV